MAKTTDRQIVNGETYFIIDSKAREDITELKSEITNWEKPKGLEQQINGGVVDFLTGDIYGQSYAEYKHTTIEVSSLAGKTVAVTGRSRGVTGSINYGLYAIYDSSDNLILSYGENETEYISFPVSLPSNAAKIIINGAGINSVCKPALRIFDGIRIEDAVNDAYNYAAKDIDDEGSHLFIKTMPPFVNGGVMNFKNNTTYLSSHGKKFEVTSGDICIISGKTSTINSTVNYNLYGFYDSEMNLLEVFNSTSSDTEYNNIKAIAPQNAAYCYVNGKADKASTLYIRTTEDIKKYIDENAGGASIWTGKRIGVLGTSVAFGANATTSYSFEAAEKLGFELSMFGVPGLAIETQEDGSPKTYGSFTLSKAEYSSAGQTIPDNPVVPYIPGGSYNDYYRTYENVFVQNNADIDLWVYAVVPNNDNFDLDDWNDFNKSTWKYNDNSSFADHRKTFIGALLFIMDQMYTLNPYARMVFVVDSSFSYDGGLSNLELVSEQWNIPIINLWGKINTSPKSLEKIKSVNGTDNHPSTFAHEMMGSMFAGDLSLVH